MFAVAGTIASRSARSARSICGGFQSVPVSNRFRSTGFREITWNCKGWTRRVAFSVITTWTDASILTSWLAKSSDLWIAIPPVTPKMIVRSLNSIFFISVEDLAIWARSFSNSASACCLRSASSSARASAVSARASAVSARASAASFRCCSSRDVVIGVPSGRYGRNSLTSVRCCSS